MKKYITIIILAAAAGSFWYWYSNRGQFVVIEPVPSEQVSPVVSPLDAQDGMYRLDPTSSGMTWKGSRPLIEGYYDHGSINLADGLVTVQDGRVASGAIIVDMASITVTGTGRGKGNDTLSRHLMSEDFFDAEQFPLSTFKLTELQAQSNGTYLVRGELTIKDATNPISFVADVRAEEGSVVMEAEGVQVDRTQWDIRYGSDSFFDDLGDELIDDIFTVSFLVVGVLQGPDIEM
jgi:polyisoprenoid-binding protein YceI